MERYETEKLSKHQFASMKSWLELLHFMLFTLDILILNQTFGTMAITPVSILTLLRIRLIGDQIGCSK